MVSGASLYCLTEQIIKFYKYKLVLFIYIYIYIYIYEYKYTQTHIYIKNKLKTKVINTQNLLFPNIVTTLYYSLCSTPFVSVCLKILYDILPLSLSFQLPFQ